MLICKTAPNVTMIFKHHDNIVSVYTARATFHILTDKQWILLIFRLILNLTLETS